MGGNGFVFFTKRVNKEEYYFVGKLLFVFFLLGGDWYLLTGTE
jgi:hypothetical protein